MPPARRQATQASRLCGPSDSRQSSSTGPDFVAATFATMGTCREIINVNQIDDIRKLGRVVANVASIVRGIGVSEPTSRKYLREPGLLKRPWRSGGFPNRSRRSPSLSRLTRSCWRTSAAGTSDTTSRRRPPTGSLPRRGSGVRAHPSECAREGGSRSSQQSSALNATAM